MSNYKTVKEKSACVEQIKKNMIAAGCSESEISDAIGRYNSLSESKEVEIAVLV